MNQVTYSSPTEADLKAKESSPEFVATARKLLSKIAFSKYDCNLTKHDGSGFYNNPFRDMLRK